MKVTVVCAWLLAAGSLVGMSEGKTAESSDLIQLLTWHEARGLGSAQSLSVSRLEPHTLRQRTLLIQGETVVLSVELETVPQNGTTSIKLADHLSGWTVSLEDATDLKSDQPFFYADSLAWADRFLSSDHAIERRLVIGEEPSDFVFSSTLWDQNFSSDFYRQMESEGMTARMVKEMPASARMGVRLVLSLLNSDADGGGPGGVFGRVEPLITILSSALDTHSGEGPWGVLTAAQWSSKVEFTGTGPLEANSVLAFPLYRFKGINLEDSWQDRPLSKVTPPSPR